MAPVGEGNFQLLVPAAANIYVTFTIIRDCQKIIDMTSEIFTAASECPWYLWNSKNRRKPSTLVLQFCL
jgi:hypothetical protein